MSKFLLSRAEIDALATLHHCTPVIKNDRDVTPILTAIRFTIDAACWRAVATDRYVVGELTGPVTPDHDYRPDDSGEPTVIQFLSTDLVDIAKRAKQLAPGIGAKVPAVEFDAGEEFVAVAIFGQQICQYRTVGGNYPLVERLFPIAGEGTPIPNVSFDPVKLARIGKVLTPTETTLRASGRAWLALRLQFSVNEHNGKPGLILVTRSGASVPEFRALIQPNMSVR